jgi:hypothetical protein
MNRSDNLMKEQKLTTNNAPVENIINKTLINDHLQYLRLGNKEMV